jgi:hypothetical protein
MNLREIDCKDKRQGMHTELQEGIFFWKTMEVTLRI